MCDPSNFHERYAKPLASIISKYVDAPHRTDLNQATWARIVEKFHLFKGGNFLAWASTVGRNVAINLRKEIDKRPQLMPGNEIVVTSSDDPFEILLRAERTTIIKGCLARLDKKRRDVFTRFIIDEETYEEIAGELDISTTTAWRWFREAKQQLSKCFETPGNN